MGAGYSKRSLVEKLGIKPGHRICLINAPQDYDAVLGSLPDDVERVGASGNNLDFIQFFTMSRAELEAEFSSLAGQIKPNGTIWISWPKRASKVTTDLDENIIREVGLAAGLVDVKVAAVDETWSGLKFVFRLKDRK
jgi:hypothetical protein